MLVRSDLEGRLEGGPEAEWGLQAWGSQVLL